MKKDIFLSLLSGLLLSLSFPNFNIWLFAWFALVPLFLAINDKSKRKVFLLSYLSGVFFWSWTIYWVVHVTLPGMVIIVLYLALYFGIFGLISSYIVPRLRPSINSGLAPSVVEGRSGQALSLSKGVHRPSAKARGSPEPVEGRTSYIVSLFLIPASWVTLEWFRSTGMFGFGWALLGHSQSFNLPIIQIADTVGAYGVSYLVVMVNVMIFLTIKNLNKIARLMIPIAACSLLIFLTLVYGYFRLNNIFTGERVKVAVIQGNVPQDKKWDYNFRDEILNKYEALTKEASKEKLDLIIWPETSVPGYLGREQDLSDRLKMLAKEVNAPLLVGAPREDEMMKDKYYNSAILLLEDGRIIAHYDKLHLVPFGEYIPFKGIFSFVQEFAKTPIGDFTKGRNYTVFKFFIERSSEDKDSSWRLIKKVKFSCLICFEDIFPDLAREFVKNGADFLVNITNDAWFGKSSAPYQHVQSSVFRAIENRVNVLRAANTGLSCFIDQKGRVIDVVEAGGENLFIDGFGSGEIRLTKTRTLYNIYGDILVYICILFTFITTGATIKF